MEQVQRTCEVLKEHGFCDLTTLECLARSFNVQNVKLAPVDFGDEVGNLTDQESSIASTTAQASGDGTSQSLGSAAKVTKVNKEDMDTEVQCSSTEGSKRKDSKQQMGSCGTQSGCSAKLRAKGREFKTGAPNVVMQGHTGFLTFASLYLSLIHI